MTFRYTDLGPGDLGCEPEYLDDPDNDDQARLAAAWAYLVDHSTETDAFLLKLLEGRKVTSIFWMPVLNELADAANHVLKQEAD